MDLPKAYDPKSVEPKWAEKWAKNPFVANPKSGKPPFVIFMPPPNVTGSSTWAMPWTTASRTPSSATSACGV